MSTTPDIVLSPDYDLLERRSKKRTTINHGALLFFAGRAGVYSCCIRNVTNDGAGIRLNGHTIMPSAFDMSLDNFRSTRRCRLIWRDADLVGAAFET